MAVAQVNGVQLYYELVGSGEPILLLNGVMMTAASWGLSTRRLAAHHRVLLHDFRGQLKSSKPTGPYSLDQHVDDLVALIDHLAIDVAHVVGTSYGGEVAMLFAARHPERVRTLTVIASVSEVDPELHAQVGRWIDVAERAPQTLYDATVPDNFSPAFRREHPEFLEAGRERFRSFDGEWFRALVDLCRSFQQLHLTPRLAEIRCPTLVICGEADILKPPRYSRLIAANVRGAKLMLIPAAGHAVFLEAPDVINEAVLNFVSDDVAGTSEQDA